MFFISYLLLLGVKCVTLTFFVRFTKPSDRQLFWSPSLSVNDTWYVLCLETSLQTQNNTSAIDIDIHTLKALCCQSQDIQVRCLHFCVCEQMWQCGNRWSSEGTASRITPYKYWRKSAVCGLKTQTLSWAVRLEI